MAKSFQIPKQEVYQAYKQVRKNRGSAGIDNQSIKDFEENLEDNLYIIWNRMSSGSYFPQPVREVKIPKGKGKYRVLGIPTITDRIAQTVVKKQLEPELEKHFHNDSYGYRPSKSALEAVGQARKRCWRYKWVVDLDIKGFFDNIDHKLLKIAVEKHTRNKWVILYIKRWLETGGEGKGTPQGGVISPLLANLFLHYALDRWMEIKFPRVPFERYADDILYHCKTKTEAEDVKKAIEERLSQCKLTLNQDKSKIVLCKSSSVSETNEEITFDFLGYTFKPRYTKSKEGRYFLGFTPAVNKAKKQIRKKIREWKLYNKTGLTSDEIAIKINSTVRGWIQYYCKYCQSEMYYNFHYLNMILVKWIKRKYKKLRGWKKAWKRLIQLKADNPNLFVHWEFPL